MKISYIHRLHGFKAALVYLPVGLILFAGAQAINHKPGVPSGVLAYATSMSLDGLLNATNSQRQAGGLETLQSDKQLTAAAQAKANDMAARDYWSHTTPEGDEPWTFVKKQGYSYSKAGENLAYGFNSSNDTINGWMNSPSHRSNMLEANYQQVGFGFANTKNYDGNGPATVVVAMYGEPASSVLAEDTNNFVTNAGTIRTVSKLDLITDKQTPWLGLMVGLMAGISATVVILKHAAAFRRLVVRGEGFVLHHPLLDIAFVAVAVVGVILTRTSGIIQ